MQRVMKVLDLANIFIPLKHSIATLQIEFEFNEFVHFRFQRSHKRGVESR